MLFWHQNDYKPRSKTYMKKQYLLLTLLVVSTFSFAQSTTKFGIRAGASHAGIRGEAVSSLQSLVDFTDGMVTTNDRTGFFGGGYVSVPVGNVLSIEPALYYSQKGYTMTGDFNIKGAEFIGANAKARLNTSYIDLPVLIKANISGLQLFAGPQISYLVDANLKTTAGVFGINLFNRTFDAKEQFNKWDAALTAGVGYQFANGLNITAAYDQGLSKADANQNTNAYNKAYKIGLGFSF